MIRRRKRSGNFFIKNETLLKQIHNSKKTFCEFEEDCYSDYDIIIHDEPITKELIEEGKKKRTERLNDEIGNKKFHNENFSNKEVDEYIEKHGWKEHMLSDSSVVFRRMTNEHVPYDFNKKGEYVKIKPTFPPFKHVIFDTEKNEERTVGWSHTKNNEWSTNHGKLNNQLGKSLLEFVNRYGNKGNWRGYTWLEEMKGQALVRLTDVILQFDESKSSNPFSWCTMVVERTFIHVLQQEKKQLRTKRKIMEDNAEFGFDISYNDQAQKDIDNYEKDNPEKSDSSNGPANFRKSGRSLSQIKAEEEKRKKEKNEEQN